MDNGTNHELLEIERQLAISAREGNDESLARLLHSVYPRVFGYIFKLTLQKDLTADIVQTAMEQAIKRFEIYREEKSAFVTWVTKIAVNALIDYYRKCKRETVALGRFVSEIPQEEGMNTLDETQAALLKLPLQQRLPVVMQYVLGYSQKDIAKALKIPLGTVKSRVFNALAFLKKEMEQ